MNILFEIIQHTKKAFLNETRLHSGFQKTELRFETEYVEIRLRKCFDGRIIFISLSLIRIQYILPMNGGGFQNNNQRKTNDSLMSKSLSEKFCLPLTAY